MKKKVSSSSKATSNAMTTLTVRDARTGKAVVVRGAGAMAGSDFKLRKSVSLLKPIAKQTLARNDKLKVG